MNETREAFWDDVSEEDQAFLRRFRLMDDDFFTMVLQKPECAEILLRLILKRQDLTVREVTTQKNTKNLWGRSLCLDVLAVDKDGKPYNIEIQRKDEGANPKRARYHSALLDASVTEPGDDFKNLIETYVIFITENDVLKAEKPLYHIHRFIEETGTPFQDGTHIIYVNSKIQDETELGKLMHDLYCTDPDEMYYEVLADEVRFYKENQEGVSQMCQIMEEIRDKSYNAGWAGGEASGEARGEAKKARELAFKMAARGDSTNEIADMVGYDIKIVTNWLNETETSTGQK